MMVVLRFAVLYAAIVFAFGFGLGAVRALFVTPVTGEFVAVLIEAPVMVIIAWIVAARIFPSRSLMPNEGIEIGLTSFLLLQMAESLLFGAFGPYRYVDNVLYYLGDFSPARLAGLIGQVLFAIIPAIQIARSPS